VGHASVARPTPWAPSSSTNRAGSASRPGTKPAASTTSRPRHGRRAGAAVPHPEAADRGRADAVPPDHQRDPLPGGEARRITPDVHYGYGVPVGCVILTDRADGRGRDGPGRLRHRLRHDEREERRARRARHARAQARVQPRGDPARQPRRRRQERQARRALEDASSRSSCAAAPSTTSQNTAPRSTAVPRRAAAHPRRRTTWDIPWGGKETPERGLDQLGTLGGGNHFIELQRCEETGTLFVQVHTGSRGFGHGLATNYFEHGPSEHPEARDRHRSRLLHAGVASLREYLERRRRRRQLRDRQPPRHLRGSGGGVPKVFRATSSSSTRSATTSCRPRTHPDFGEVWVHRKGATRAFPAGTRRSRGTPWGRRATPC
jgi:tRNA-splicing ligase RtcB